MGAAVGFGRGGEAGPRATARGCGPAGGVGSLDPLGTAEALAERASVVVGGGDGAAWVEVEMGGCAPTAEDVSVVRIMVIPIAATAPTTTSAPMARGARPRLVPGRECPTAGTDVDDGTAEPEMLSWLTLR